MARGMRWLGFGPAILIISTGIATQAAPAIHVPSRRRSASPSHPEFYFNSEQLLAQILQCLKEQNSILAQLKK